MAVSLRLQRVGKRNQAQYRIIAIDSRKRGTGEPLEVLGHYHPGKKLVELDTCLLYTSPSPRDS